MFDVHLMIAPADPYLAAFAEAGADIITVHAEAGPHLDRSLQAIRALGKKAGVSLNPGDARGRHRIRAHQLDLILLMTVNPGFGGQRFIPAVVDKIRRVKAMIGNRPIDIEVDGGIGPETAGLVAAAGANVLVAGSAVFKGGTRESLRRQHRGDPLGGGVRARQGRRLSRSRATVHAHLVAATPLFFICAKHRGHKGKQSQAPKQVLGVVTLHAVCEERHVVVPEPSSHFVWTGPLPTRPFP